LCRAGPHGPAPDGATVVARFADGPDGGQAAGQAAITRNEHGSGVGWYVSTHVTGEALTVFLDGVYADAGVVPDRSLPREVEVIRRRGVSAENAVDFTVVLNHTDEPVPISVQGDGLLNGSIDAAEHSVGGGGVEVIRGAPR
jgi:beta-galactosidase